MQSEIIEVILTGGRIEKVINEEIGRLNYTDTSFKAWVEQAHCPLNFSKHLLMLKDSQDITDADLEAITACCTHTPGKRVIIAHGVNTMIRTALHLKQFEIPKTIVLFGAFVPYSLQKSDALFNFGTALAASQLLPHGVYIAMNGIVIPAEKAMRDPQTGGFTF
ncbi:MAG: asparaginase [Lentisphaeria bacterium]|nr:asparaginase [Lentisphaeria bacterium]